MIRLIIFFTFNICFILPQNIENLYKDIQSKLITDNKDATITLPEGKFYLERSLWGEDLNNVVIKGMGQQKTIISLKNQIEGAEGLKIINSQNITLRDFTIEDSKGDLIKIEDSSEINIINVTAQWTDGPKETNGSYGLYPVKSVNILVDNCIVSGASDAGIYIGQSHNIIVRNSKVYNNVAGIEIENSSSADVYNNFAYNNTGGILVFDLPDLLIKTGGEVRVFNNLVVENNLYNFAPEGNIVAKVPSGTGIMILATSFVDIFNNIVYNNRTANTSIVSYFLTEEPLTDSLYYPYPTSINIYNNIYKRDIQFPSFSFKQPIGFLLAYHYWRDIPDIIYDGVLDPKLINDNGILPAEEIYFDKHRICIKNNINASVVNLDAGNNFKNISTNETYFDCELENINPVKYPFE